MEAPGLTPVSGSSVPGSVAKAAGLRGNGLGLPLPPPLPGRRAAVGRARPGMAFSGGQRFASQVSVRFEVGEDHYINSNYSRKMNK